MDDIIKVPLIVQTFINEKIICTKTPLLPCIYGDFEDMQMGYRYDPVQECSLITEKPGSWQKSWYVIAQNALGDPFFLDLDKEDYPVYTAMHGSGAWEPIVVAESLVQFTEILHRINETDLTFPYNLEFLAEQVESNNEFWMEVNESCREDD